MTVSGRPTSGALPQYDRKQPLTARLRPSSDGIGVDLVRNGTVGVEISGRQSNQQFYFGTRRQTATTHSVKGRALVPPAAALVARFSAVGAVVGAGGAVVMVAKSPATTKEERARVARKEVVMNADMVDSTGLSW